MAEPRLPGDLITVPKGKIIFNCPFITDQCTTVRITNSDPNRIAYRIKPQDVIRVLVKPDKGLLHTGQHADIRVDYRKFIWEAGQPMPVEDGLLIEWTEVPAGAEEFKPAWFETSTVTRRLFLPVGHNV